MKMLKTNLLTCILIALVPLGVAAQGFSGYNWYFGSSPQGIRFSRSTDSATLVNNQAIPFGAGGSAVACSDPERASPRRGTAPACGDTRGSSTRPSS